jgi:predicted anti-sigma-YlaC factor YlaD
MSTCPSGQEIEALVDDAASGGEEAWQHLDECAKCRRRYEQALALRRAAQALPPAAPALSLAAVQAAVAAAPRLAPLTCAQAQRLLEEYLDDALSSPLRARLEVHLFTCSACYRRYRAALDLQAGLGALPIESPPADLPSRICAVLSAQPARQRLAGPAQRLSWAWAAVVVAGLLMAELVLHKPAHGPGMAPPLAGPAREAPALPRLAEKAPPSVHGASVTPPAAAKRRPAAQPAMRSQPSALAVAAGASGGHAAGARLAARRPAPPPSRFAAALTAPAASPPGPQAGAQGSGPSSAQGPAARAPTAPGPGAAQVAQQVAPGPSLPPPVLAAAPASTPPAPAPSPPAVPSAEHGSSTAPPLLARPGATALAAVPAGGPTPAPIAAVQPARPQPAPAPAPRPTTPPTPVRIAEARLEGTPRWLPLRAPDLEHVVVAAASPAGEQIQEAARRLNEQLRRDQQWTGAGWITIK